MSNGGNGVLFLRNTYKITENKKRMENVLVNKLNKEHRKACIREK